MNKSVSQILKFSTALSLMLGVSLLVASKKDVNKVDGYSTSSLPTTIDLNDTSAANIRSYYSSLNSLGTSERQGNNLLKNLKSILKNGQQYFSYDSGNAIWQIYEIADRDWVKSPASSTTYGTYNSSTNKITNYSYGSSSSNSKNNPYIHALYINRNVNNQTTAWDDHQQTQWGINREHVWPKAEGFETSAAGGARGDPMHLMAGNGYANNIHSNYYYGYVNTSSSYTNCGSKYSNVSGNLLGKSKTLGGTTNVFEPQDCDKGDIARAIFYMVARYNYLSGSDSDGIDSDNPNLSLTQSLSDWSSTGYSSTTSRKGYMGIMTDLLAWHHADPVDEFEIHRNNLLYTNYTKNRNPFIDFPEWADFIWGSVNYSGSTYISHSTTPTGYAAPSSDTINGYNGGGGSETISVTGVTLNTNSTTVEAGQDVALIATIAPSNATNQGVSWTTSNASVATVSGGIVTGVAEGSATITVTTSDGGFTASCTVSVTPAAIVDPVEEGSVTAVGGALDGWTRNDSDSYADGSAKFDAAGDNAYRVDIFSGNVASRMKLLTVTVNGKINGTPTSANAYKVEALDSSGNVLASKALTGSDIVTTSYGDAVFTIDSGLTGCTGIKVTYLTKGGGNWGIKSISWSATYSSEEQEIILNSIVVKTAPNKTTYTAGEDFSPVGLVLTGTFSDSSTQDISYNGNEDAFDFDPYDNLQTTDTSITISYGGKTCSQAITVSPAKTLSSISLNTDNVTKSFSTADSFSSAGLVVTAHFSDSSTADVSSEATVITPDMTTAGQKTVTVSYTYGGNTETSSYQITVTPAKGSETNPFTVAEARAEIDAHSTSSDKYTRGIVCKVDSYNSTYHSITYWISDDGVNQNALQVYGGKGLDGSDFSSINDLSLGDTVVVGGNLKKYNSTYEYDLNSVIISITPVTPESDEANYYSLVTDVSKLLTGDKVIIVGVNSSTYYTMSGISNNVMACTTITSNNDNLEINSSTMTFTIEKSASGYRFRNSSNQYLATASSNSTACGLESGEPTDISLFNISYTNNKMSIIGVDSGQYTRRTLQYNYNSGNARFAFYRTASVSAVSIYKKTTQVNADAWSETFLNSTSDGDRTCNVNNWSVLASSYKALSEGAQSEIINVEANSSTYYSLRAQAMARYDFFMGDPRFNQGEHFIVGRVSSLSVKPSLLLSENNNEDSIVLIAVCAIVSLTTVSMLLIIKKRRNINA